MDGGIYEIEWRELLVKRLKSAQTVLKRDAAKEEKQRTEAKQLAAGYGNYEEAHEAYGWGYITQKQLDTIQALFDEQENQSQSALRRITRIIGEVQGEINMLRNEFDYRHHIVAEVKAARDTKNE